jgi:activator of HSP90 ATPase
MALASFEVSTVLPVDPLRVYQAWLSSAEHSAFTGSPAIIDPVVGGQFTAWDDYISGATVELVPFSRIVQRWRTTEFPPGAEDSLVSLSLEPDGCCGTRLTLQHTDIPEGQDESYRQGWLDYYFEPMQRYFAE